VTTTHHSGIDLTDTPEPAAPTRPSAVPVWVRCVLAGVALVAAVPPWGWWPLGIVGIAMLDGLIADQPARRRFRRTWLVSAVWLSIGMFWMWDMTPPGYVVAFVAYAGYFAVAAALVPPGRGRRIALPGAIALAEGIRWAFPFGGVPLATIPQGQVAGPLAEVVRVAGPMLLVMVTVVAGQALAAALRRERDAAGIGTAVVVATVLVAVLAPVPTSTGTLDVALVQGGGPQRTRDSVATRPIVFQNHLDATELIEGPVDLVLWPENVVHVGQDFDTSPRVDQLAELARELDTTVVVGVVETADRGLFYNYAVVFDPAGEVIDRYDKVRRVPFGEMTPFRGLLERIAGDTIVASDSIPGTEPAMVDTPVEPHVGRHLVGGVLRRPCPRGRRTGRRGGPQPHQRRVVLAHHRPDPADRLVAAPGARDRSVGPAGRAHRLLGGDRPRRHRRRAHRHLRAGGHPDHHRASFGRHLGGPPR
jgi:apolipoprotein N-acyltransferase